MSNAFRKRAPALLLGLILFLGLQTPALASSAPDSSGSGSSETVSSSQPDAAGETETVAPAWGEGSGIYTPSFEVKAPGVCLVFEDSGLVVYEKNADEPYSSASLNKMMTAILVMENVADLEATITVDHGWVYDELYGMNASHADIRRGETLSIRELLNALLIPSANEAALILADYISGGHVENFLFMMQTRAESLGCTGTVFADPNGLSPDSVTTARDMCKITRAFKSHPELCAIAATATYEMAAHEQHDTPYNLFTTNRLIMETSPYYSAFPKTAGSVKGGKTGSLGEWQNFASWAEKDDAGYICAVLNSPPEADEATWEKPAPIGAPALYETARLYDWALTELVVRPVLDTEQPITEIPVKYTTEVDALKLYPSTDLRTLLKTDAKDSDITKRFQLPEFVAAPVTAGTVVGTLTLTLEGRVIGTAELLAERDVARNNTLYTVRKSQEFLSGYLKYIIIGAIALVVLYIALVAALHNKRQKKKRGGRR